MLRNKKATTIKSVLLLLTCSLLFISCQQQNSLEGLWQVEKVQMGDNQMTPIARWVRFNKDGTQISGNGWLQHSFGTYDFNQNTLSVVDENGTVDNADPFTVEINGEQMFWKRQEEGQQVTVSLKRINKIPQSEGNKLMGLWKLVKATDDGNDITAILNSENKSMLHLRWDNTYVQHNMPKGKKYGIYKIHGHKPEIQLVNYGAESKFSFWSFSFQGSKLTLTTTDQKSEMIFERINEFIQ